MASRTLYTAVALEVYTAANHLRMPKGAFGYGTATSNQTGITSDTDLTGLTTGSITVPANRLIRITAKLRLSGTVADGITIPSIKEDGTIVQYWYGKRHSTDDMTVMFSVFRSPTGGSHTYKVSLQRFSGTGTVGNTADGTNPSFILVEDLGPSF
jgi:hypothetical protein